MRLRVFERFLQDFRLALAVRRFLRRAIILPGLSPSPSADSRDPLRFIKKQPSQEHDMMVAETDRDQLSSPTGPT